MKKLLYLSLLLALFCSCASRKQIHNAIYPKREFRGAWIQAVNGQFTGMDEEQMKNYLLEMLDNLQKVNVNAIIFQVRVEGDALYPSSYEPWSRFITGEQGTSPGWDPLAFMVKECHRRNMELHAWINPYRARTKTTKFVALEHPSVKNPKNFVEYEGQLYFNPALQSNRDHICRIVKDILTRYDVDGLHIDDYFYPYPTKGVEFPDDKWFAASGRADRGEWRRENVNHLIYQLHRTVREVKPWVKFGVSPFGIYRNEKNWEFGSKTNGLQCYDELNADVLFWIEQGWVDYCIPQIYWEIGHAAADYEELVGWWAKYASKRPLYIGQDVVRTVKAKDTTAMCGNQQQRKYDLQRAYSTVSGSCFWDAASAAKNMDGYRDFLASGYYKYPALMPYYNFIDKKAPAKVRSIRMVEDEDGTMLLWLVDDKAKNNVMDSHHRFVVYCFEKGEKVDLENPAHIMAITDKQYLRIPYSMQGEYVFVITVLDRLQNESKGVKYKANIQ
ncbi:MAG: family 10 glycosylhydrolase [Bacteroidaceae bacterium]|nr:family 10 glycosylhydrolase [Bacteroidaceae bacterium]